jgi:hypothetical protein
MQKTLGIVLCVLGAIVLAVFSISAGDWYWLFLTVAALLGVAAGVIKNLPNRES